MQLLVALTQPPTETVNVSSLNTTHSSDTDTASQASGNDPKTTFISEDIADIGLHLEAIVILSIFVSSLFINCLMFYVFNRKPSLLTLSNRFVLNLGVCNILNTVSAMPAVFVSLITKDWVLSEPLCQMAGFLTEVSFTCNSLTLVVISLDRYCAVISPLRYKMKVTSQRSWFVIAAVWIVSMATSLPPLIGWSRIEYQPDKFTCTVTWYSHKSRDQYYTVFIFLLNYVLPLTVILITYAVMFRAAMHNSSRTPRLNIPPPCIAEVSVYRPISKRSITDSRVSLLSTKQWLAEKSARSVPSHFRKDLYTTARTTFIVIFSFIFCWSPFYLCSLLESFLPERNTVYLPIVISHMAYCLTLSNTVVTPIVYVFRNRIIRREMERTFFPGTIPPPKLTSVYRRQIVNTKVVSRGNSIESVIDEEPSSGSFIGFTNNAFDESKCNAV